METDFCCPSLPPRFTQSVQSSHGAKHSDPHSEHSEQPQRVSSSKAKNIQTKRNTRFRQNIFHSLYIQRKISPLSILKGLLSMKGLLLSKTNNNKITQTQSFMSDLPSQYAEEVETFRHILDLPDPWDPRKNA